MALGKGSNHLGYFTPFDEVDLPPPACAEVSGVPYGVPRALVTAGGGGDTLGTGGTSQVVKTLGCKGAGAPWGLPRRET